MSASSKRRAPSLRRLVAIGLATFGLLVAALIVVTTLQLAGSQRQSDAENRRAESFLVADSMRQSSNELTNMVRLYVSTGDPRSRDYYNEILAIRSGAAPRPRGYDSSFWDRVLAEGTGFVRYGPRESLVEQMRAADFTPAEFRALNASLTASNRLAQVELEVMDRVARRIRRGVDDAYLSDVQRDYRRLVDQDYLDEKGVIMAAIGRFIDLVDERTRRDVQDERDTHDALVLVQIAILALIVLLAVAAMAVISRLAVRPLGRLADSTRRIAGGDYGERADVHGVAELEQVAGAFNEMADAIESDLGARERAEREAVAARLAAEHASRAKSTFLAAMSHEIRTPMIGVTGMLEVLSRTGLSPQQRQMVATAESSALSLLQIIGDVLDFSKIEASKLELNPAPIDLRRIVHTAVETFRHTASAKGLLLTSAVDERLAAAHTGDALRLRQILTNFISNAVKFTEVGGIELEARVLEDSGETQTVELSVTDTGVGISAEQQRALFSDYTQADASTAQRYGGTGLGLVICRKLASLMDGEVTMHSAPGQGTTMRLRVPLAIADPASVDSRSAMVTESTAATRPQADARGGRARRQRAAHRRGPRRQPHGPAPSARRRRLRGRLRRGRTRGVRALCDGDYALLLTDLNMPRMDGYELAHAVRHHETATGRPRIPILALTANVMQGEPERCREAGMDGFAAKPTTIPFLAGKLRQWLPHLDWPSAADHDASARTGEAPAGGAVDLAVLAEVTGGDTDLEATLIDDFLVSARTDLRALDDAFTIDDATEARRRAHRVKGAARTVGATTMVALAQQIEAGLAPDAGARAHLAPKVARLHDALAECEAELASLR